ncbi:type II toxin-antitoxin system RelE/ParE family toxin [Comamonas badia]|uniref:type II toxin-antitoxin system RelE/ParE family toxin n=1 Tax=Comamonas badia TaxID=265291 RepID=UPI00042940FC|nr:type II toxin-antitoxin system RelE/ParE family toxin [Comamonas badia]
MPQLELAPEVLDDFDRFFNHIARYDPQSAPERIGAIVQALQVLTHSPLIGRPARGGLRELVIGHGTRGYVALYRFVPPLDTAFVLAIRHQSEAGFSHP